jgi:hypothetical protein
MIRRFDFQNLNGAIWQFNTDTWPLKEFEVDGDIRSDEVARMQEHGIWEARTYLGKLLIHTTGDALFNTPEDYIAARLNMLNTLIPAGVIESARRMGRLFIGFDGITEDFYQDCTFDGYPTLPMMALYPSVTEFQITYKLFKPYMIGVQTGKFYTI